MGTFLSSYSIVGAHHHEVRELVARWLRSKGFEEMPGPRLFALDGTHERGLTLVWNDRWTTLQYSDMGEEERLVYELHKLERPLLHLWVHDSDLWGYELGHRRRVVAAFNSNPRYFGATEEPEADNDLEVVCSLCGVQGIEAELRKVQRQRAVFKEEPCARFAEVLGPAAAAFSYEDMANDGAPVPEGFNHQHLWFRHYDFDPMAGFHLHRIDARCGGRPSGPLPGMENHYRKMVSLVGEEKAREAWQRIFEAAEQSRQDSGECFAEVEGRPLRDVEDETAERDDELPPEVQAQRREIERRMRRMRWQVGCLTLLARPLGWLFKPIFSLLMWRTRRRIEKAWAGSMATVGAAPERPAREQDGWLINDLHGLRVQLAPGARTGESDQLPPMPASVFTFAVGEVAVWCTAERSDAVRWRITGWPPGTELEQKNVEVDGHPAKLIVAAGSRGNQAFVELLYMVQTAEGVYVFQTEPGARPTEEELGSFRRTVESLTSTEGW